MIKILAVAALMLAQSFQAAAIPAESDPAISRRSEDRIVRFINTGMPEGLANASVSTVHVHPDGSREVVAIGLDIADQGVPDAPSAAAAEG